MPASTTPRVTLIAALASDRGIGLNNQLLWHLPEDMAHFRRQTQGCPVIMGRKTWDSLPPRFRPLPGRQNIVITRQAGFDAPGAVVTHSVEDALAAADNTAPRVFVIGGEQIYQAALPLADELVLTEVELTLPADAFFPAWEHGSFTETSRERHQAAAPNAFHFSFVSYQRSPARN